jgi:hypothetical protein
MTDTPQEREAFLKGLQQAFSGVATVGFEPAGQQGDITGGTVYHPQLAYGFDRDHYWVTLSYADAARGAISTASAACKARFPKAAALCTSLASLLQSWVRGRGSANNHGVWAAVYINRITGGRW